MRILLVSDAAEEREQLKQGLKEELNKADVWEAADMLEAAKRMKQVQPDFLFMNIDQIQDKELLGQHESQVILMGTEERQAVQAFRHRAFYFLLLPIAEHELSFVCSLMEREAKRQTNVCGKLSIEGHEGILYLQPRDIVYVSKNKENKTVSIYTRQQQYVSSCTLHDLEEKLTPYQFQRVHKSYLVNLLYIKELRPYYNGTYNLYLESYPEEPIPVSRNYVKKLRSSLEI
ncbi:LytR/AlgR family response regulator transcription factor [Ectobacillus ponti]|uniref:LytTR family DNA-binding domain-containing protein n=1 Tax=Ectobacillus ponti TaxID=2961894 RepID=A0AA41X734_9BACI|nr:LytTR family DNA-binding domain-containing protein [Ectobacillus ponti]MCP8968045.1 LytTR family DNA-binding domain-containing protein [Ectobacillus ponti]